MSLNDATSLLIRLWSEARGVDFDHDLRNPDVRYINEARRSDPTGLTAFMVTRSIVAEYLGEKTFAAIDLVSGDKDTGDELQLMREIFKALYDVPALADVMTFRMRLTEAAKHYGVFEKCKDSIADEKALAHIRKDALAVTSILSRHTFARGESSNGTIGYNRQLFQFWNVNSMLRSVKNQSDDGITMVLLVDADVITSSSFCFMIRDGENITMWSDLEPSEHPMQKHMSRSRSRGRALESRADKLRFPYQMLDVVMDDGYAFQKANDGLVRSGSDGAVLAMFDEMEPDQLLWAIMALDVLRKEEHSDELSFTGESMLNGLPAPGGNDVFPMLTSKDVDGRVISEQLDEHSQSTGCNRWMEDRYGDQVDDRILNLVSHTENEPLDGDGDHRPVLLARKGPGALRSGDTDISAEDPHKALAAMLPKTHGLCTKGAKPGAGSDLSKPNLIGFDPTSFGTRSSMERDRVWVARWNQAQAIGMAAAVEYRKTWRRVFSWFSRRVQARQHEILCAITRREWIEKYAEPITEFASPPVSSNDMIRMRKTCRGRGFYWPFPWVTPESGVVSMLEGWMAPSMSRLPRSVISGERARMFVLLKPETAVGIAELAGCSVSDLPVPLQHWSLRSNYDGNDILDRLDPLDTMVGNPWKRLLFEVRIGVSKNDWNGLVREHGSGYAPWEEVE